MHQRWESLFPTPLLFQNFWIRVRFGYFLNLRIRLLFSLRLQSLIQSWFTHVLLKKWPHNTPTAAEIEKWHRIRFRFFTNFLLRDRIQVRKKSTETCRSRLRHSRSGTTSDVHEAVSSFSAPRGIQTQVFSSPTPVMIQEAGILIRILFATQKWKSKSWKILLIYLSSSISISLFGNNYKQTTNHVTENRPH